MNYLLDTCVVSELVKPLPNKAVVRFLNTVPDNRLFLSVITIGELRKGINKLPDSKKRNKLDDWLNNLLVNYKEQLYAVDAEVAEIWGILQANAENKGSPMASIDSLIAATARTHNLILVTRNEKDFTASDIEVLNPWDS